ncbi:cutinase-domain-containing protein [Xylariaceae sp. FL0255]|nr:cutinase-domain-containing protein [Xylariaceae sp. FL0255]
MKSLSVIPALVAASAGAVVDIEERQSCPSVYIFGARETTAPAGYGTAGGLVDMVLAAYPGSGSAPISYPACGGQSTCGGISYADSAQQGTTAVIEAVTAYNEQCPNTQIVLIGYSQGGEIMDNALCGGEGTTLTGAALAAVKVAIFMGDPHYVYGLPYDVGTCTAGGFDQRPAGYVCSPASASILKSYCDSSDPYCCNGDDAATHQGYVTEYGSQALAFIESKLSSTGSTTTTTSGSSPTTSPTGSGTVAEYGQCGGIGYTGPTTCVSPYTCKEASAYYSQCL